jgi:alpha-galactosidase
MTRRTSVPPLGWNSYDCYGNFVNERILKSSLEAFVRRLKPHGYEYLVIDAGWYHDFELDPRTGLPNDSSPIVKTHLTEWGVFAASPNLFPSGLKRLIAEVHAAGVKFGLHVMRGIPRLAVERNLPVKGTPYTARDVANQNDVCGWCPWFYGVDMSKPGAQDYYDSVIEYLAELGVDFIKADDMTQYPEEITALANAIDKIKPEIVLSLSPGGDHSARVNLPVYRRADMIRLTSDIWDNPQDLQRCFERWEMFENDGSPGFWLDLDMICFGALQVFAEPGGNERENALLSGKGFRRQCQLTDAQKRTFITMRALSASPLFMGGELTQTSEADMQLITHPRILECNRNGMVGKRIYSKNDIDIRRVVRPSDDRHGWMGIFNRSGRQKSALLSSNDLQLDPKIHAKLLNIWPNQNLDFRSGNLPVTVEPDDVLFIEF